MKNVYPPIHTILSTRYPAALFGFGRSYVLKPLFFLFLATFFCKPATAAGTASFETCPPGLQHHFGFDEQQDGGYVDGVSGNKAICPSCPSTAASLFGGAQRFENGNKINFTNVDNFNWGLEGSFTIEFWIQTTAKPSQNMVVIGRNATESSMMWWAGVDTEGYAVFELWDKERNGFSMRHEGKKVNDGNWHHIAVVRDNNMKFNKLYVDGFAVEGFEYFYKTGFESAAPVNIGYLNLDKGYHYNGLLDELMVYNRALEYTELNEQYNSGAGSYCGPKEITPQIISDPKAFGVEGQSYTYTIKATGNPAPAFRLVSGPAGMAVNASTGAVDWVPATAGKYSVVVKAENSVGQDEQQYEITVKKGMDEQNGILHHWMLNESSGLIYKDFYTPYNAHSEQATKPIPVFGVIGGGQGFDGVDDEVDVRQSMNFDWDTNDNFTIELWVRSATGNTPDNKVFIGRDAKDSYAHWWLGADENGHAGFQLRNSDFDGGYIGSSGPKLNDGAWHQVVAVRNSNSSLNSLYVDGKKVAEKSFTFRNGFATLAPVNIGYLNRSHGYYYKGDLDEVKLFGRALSASEIQERYTKVFDSITELISFEGRFAVNVVNLDWETAGEFNNDYFIVERGTGDDDFIEIGRVTATGTTNQQSAYRFVDKFPMDGLNYYRLKIMKKGGLFTYSPTVLVEKAGLNASSFFVYPNPLSGGEVNIKVTNMPKGENVMFMISDFSGKKLLQQDIAADDVGLVQMVLPMPDNIRSGIYQLSVITKNKTISRKLVVVR